MSQSSLTRAEFAVLVGEELEMLDREAGDVLSTTESDIITEATSRHWEGLIEDSKATWLIDEIPSAVADDLAMIIADKVKNKFGKGDYAGLLLGTMGLNKYIAKKSDGVPTKGNFF